MEAIDDHGAGEDDTCGRCHALQEPCRDQHSDARCGGELLPQQVAIESRSLAGLGDDEQRVIEALTLLVDTLDRAAGQETRELDE
ncbi:MAG: hypothetical protein ACRDO8_12925 [Nocardioidaceae bacterium]